MLIDNGDGKQPRRYVGDTHASLSFKIYACPDFRGAVLAEGNYLMTLEMRDALLEEARKFGWHGDAS